MFLFTFATFDATACFFKRLISIFKHKKLATMAFELTDSNFQQEVLDKTGVTMIDFWAEWCGPCLAIGPIIEKLSDEYKGKALVGKVNVDHNPEIAVKYGIRSIPTILVIKNGEVVNKHVGVTTQASLAQMLDSQLS